MVYTGIFAAQFFYCATGIVHGHCRPCTFGKELQLMRRRFHGKKPIMPNHMDINIKDEVAALNLGKKIKNLRKLRGFTLQAVSDLTGLSKPLLSQIENNIAAPPIATLIKISSALGVKISHFFQDEAMDHSRIAVVRKNERFEVRKLSHHNYSSDIGYRYQSLAYPMAEKQMEPFIAEIEDRKDTELLYNNHVGEEFMFVLEGTLEFRTARQNHVITAGDAIYFDSSISHAVRGVGGPAKILVIVFTPRS